MEPLGKRPTSKNTDSKFSPSPSENMTPDEFTKLMDSKSKFIEDYDKKLANTLNISALSILNAISKQKHKQTGKMYLYNYKSPQSLQKCSDELLPPQDEDVKVGHKDFAIMYVDDGSDHPKKLMSLMDSGADLSLITLEYLKTIMPKEVIEANMKECVAGLKKMSSYSNNALNVIGRVKLRSSYTLHPRVEFVDLYLQVINDNDVFYPFLVGKDIMRRLLIDTNNVSDIHGNVQVQAMAKYPESYDFPIRSCSVDELNQVNKNLQIKARETKIVHLALPEDHHYNIGDKILVTYIEDEGLSSIPSLNTLTEDNDLFITISNLTNKNIERQIICVCEIVPPESSQYQISATVAKGTPIMMPVLANTPFQSQFSMTSALPTGQESITNVHAFNINRVDKEETPPLPDLNKIDINTVPYEGEDADDHPARLNDNYGYEKSEFLTVEEVVDLAQFPDYMQPHVKHIFLEKYSSIVSRSPLDLGQVSKTLGFYSIELMPGQKLPSYKKLYYMAPEERRMMTDLVGFLIKYGVLERVDNRMLDGEFNSKFFSPAYVISKKDPEASGRLITDYSTLNSIIQTRPPCIPEINTILHSLRDCVFLSSLDVSSAFYSVSLAEDSKAYTRFISPLGLVQFRVLPMGLASSPQVFDSFAQRILHYKADTDAQGNLVFDADGVLSMTYDPLPNCSVFYDDFIIASKLMPTFEESLQAHFNILEQVASRLAFHSAKINFQKSKICKSKIKFLGWEISFNRICPDRSRVERLLEAPMPDSKKALRSFLGLVNTLRQCLSQDFIRQLQVLTPLTSAIKEYVVEDKHIKAFEEIKHLLTTAEIFVNIISVHTQKVLFTDSSDEAFSGVLCQIAEAKDHQRYLPPCLGLNNPVHQKLYDLQLDYVPVPLYLHAKTLSRTEFKQAPLAHQELAHYYELPLCGYAADQVHDSLFHAVRSIQYAYGCKLVPINELRSELTVALKKSIVGHQVKDYSFGNNLEAYKKYLEALKDGTGNLDRKLYTLNVLHKILRRKCIFISTILLPNDEYLMETGEEYLSPPFVFGIYEREQHYIITPYFRDKNVEYNLESFQKRLEICSFYSKAVSPAEKSYSIFEKEILALVTSLDHFRKLIGRSNLMVLVDNKSLFMCLSRKLQAHYPKLHRWALRIQFLFPQLQIKFVRSGRNIADFLSRSSFTTRLRDVKRLPLKKYAVAPEISDFIDYNKIYSLEEFQSFVDKNNQLLTEASNPPSNNHGIAALNRITKTMTETLRPINIVQKRMEHDNIRLEQKLQYQELFNQCLASENFHYVTEKQEYRLQHGLLYIKHQDEFLVLLPDSLIGLFVSYMHVTYGHSGLKKMISLLYPYHFSHKYTLVAKFLRSCYSCFLNSGVIKPDFLASFFVPEYAFESVHCDLIESLPPQQKYAHIFIMVCPLSNLLLAFPIKLKTSETIIYILNHAIFPFFRVRYFLSDAGSLFASSKFRAALNALNIHKVDIARLSPSHNGLAEVTVRYFKKALKKYLATREDMNWLPFVPIITKVHNLTRASKTAHTPLQLLFGNSEHTQSPWSEKLLPEHKLLSNTKVAIENANVERENMVRFAKNVIEAEDKKLKAKLNKRRTLRKFKVGQIVYTLDRRVLPGNTRSLSTLYSPDLFVVLKPMISSSIIQKICDGMRFYYKNNDIKPYHPHSNDISIPGELKPYLSIPVEDWEEEVFALVRKYSQFQLPQKALSLATSEEIADIVDHHVDLGEFENDMLREKNNLEVLTESEESSASDKDEPLHLTMKDMATTSDSSTPVENKLELANKTNMKPGDKDNLDNLRATDKSTIETSEATDSSSIPTSDQVIDITNTATPDPIQNNAHQVDRQEVKEALLPNNVSKIPDEFAPDVKDIPKVNVKKKRKKRHKTEVTPRTYNLRSKQKKDSDSDDEPNEKDKTVTFSSDNKVDSSANNITNEQEDSNKEEDNE